MDTNLSYHHVHSDYLIHWTGKDIDNGKQWDSVSSSRTDESETRQYVERLRSILKYGLWMTKEEKPEIIKMNGQEHTVPQIPRTCFTELRLSESRFHAKDFGRLGIGVKRPFVFERFGAPVIYFRPDSPSWYNMLLPPFMDWSTNPELLNYFKPMGERTDDGLTYGFFNESEWRIIYSPSINRLLNKEFKKDITEYIENAPMDSEWFNSLQGKKPDYLIQLNAWFSVIIYPSLAVKNAAFKDEEIRELIVERKSIGAFPAEQENQPIELDLDSCRNL